MATFTKVTLYTDRDGRAKWREEEVPLAEGTPQAMLSAVFPSAGYQLRHSPVGFRSPWHCTPSCRKGPASTRKCTATGAPSAANALSSRSS